MLQFLQYMFAPVGEPWWQGAFWSNQLQWTVVTLPSLVVGLWRLDHRNKKRHEDLKRHVETVRERVDTL